MGPRTAPTWAATHVRPVLLPASVGFFTSGQPIASASSLPVPIGESAAPAAAVSLPGAGGSSRLSSLCVSVVILAVGALGVVRLGGRRLPACRCSRGRRPTGSDSEATGPLAALLQRHRRGVGGRSTRTQPRHACLLQRPCSLPRCSCQPSMVGGRHARQRPVADSIPNAADRAGRRSRSGIFRRRPGARGVLRSARDRCS